MWLMTTALIRLVLQAPDSHAWIERASSLDAAGLTDACEMRMYLDRFAANQTDQSWWCMGQQEAS
jgi:hypothetical protein